MDRRPCKRSQCEKSQSTQNFQYIVRDARQDNNQRSSLCLIRTYGGPVFKLSGRLSSDIKSSSTILKMQTSYAISCPLYTLSKQSSTKEGVYWFTVMVGSVSLAHFSKFSGLLDTIGGTGRSATIVAAYLMYSRNLDPEAALEIIRNVRPNIEYVQLNSLSFSNYSWED